MVLFLSRTLWVTGGAPYNEERKSYYGLTNETYFIDEGVEGFRPGPLLPSPIKKHCIVAFKGQTRVLIHGGGIQVDQLPEITSDIYDFSTGSWMDVSN